MSEDSITTIPCSCDACYACGGTELDDHILGIDVECLHSNLYTELGSLCVAGHCVVSNLAVVDRRRFKERVDGVGDGLGQIIYSGTAVDQDLDLGGVIGVAKVGEPSAGIPIALCTLIFETVGCNCVECVEGFSKGSARRCE